MTYEKLIEECKAMRSRAERAEAEFLVFLMDAEVSHEDIWRAAGINTFDAFLLSTKLCKPLRYQAFVRGVERIGRETALKLGAHLTIEQASVRSPETTAAMVGRAEAFVELNQVAPSEETVKSWRRELDGPRPNVKHGTERAADELHRLRAENQKLRADLKTAKREIAKLRKALDRQEPEAAE